MHLLKYAWILFVASVSFAQITPGGGGSGGGGVTSVGFVGDGTLLSSTPSAPVTSTGNVAATLATQAANCVLGNFTGSTATPNCSIAPVFAITSLTGTCSACSIGGSAANLSGSQTANYFYAAPNGSAGVGAWRAIVAADVPPLAYDASGAAATAQAASLQKANNLSDLANAATARTNLGLGSAATASTSAFDAAGAASTAQANAIAASAPLTNPSNGQNNYAPLVNASLTTPNIGIPSAGVITNFSGTCASCSIGGSAPAGSLTGSTLASGVTASSLTSAAGGTFGTAAFNAIGTSGATVGLLNATKTDSGTDTFSGQATFSYAPGTTASVSAVTINQQPNNTGSSTTTLPALAMFVSGATLPTSLNSTGVFFGINAASGSTADFADFRINGGTTLFKIGSSGNVTAKSFTGGLQPNISTKTANYSVTSSDGTILCNASSGNITITLPTTPNTTFYNIKKIDSSANTCTITAGGTTKIDGGTTVTLSSQYANTQIQGDGTTQYWII